MGCVWMVRSSQTSTYCARAGGRGAETDLRHVSVSERPTTDIRETCTHMTQTISSVNSERVNTQGRSAHLVSLLVVQKETYNIISYSILVISTIYFAETLLILVKLRSTPWWTRTLSLTSWNSLDFVFDTDVTPTPRNEIPHVLSWLSAFLVLSLPVSGSKWPVGHLRRLRAAGIRGITCRCAALDRQRSEENVWAHLSTASTAENGRERRARTGRRRLTTNSRHQSIDGPGLRRAFSRPSRLRLGSGRDGTGREGKGRDGTGRDRLVARDWMLKWPFCSCRYPTMCLNPRP